MRRHRVARGQRVVLQAAGPGDERFGVVGGVEEAAAGVLEAGQHDVDQLPRGDEPALVEGRSVEREEPVGQMRVVLQDAGVLRPPVLPRSQQAAVRRAQLAQDEVRRFGRDRA